jgi:hypothetical protein
MPPHFSLRNAPHKLALLRRLVVVDSPLTKLVLRVLASAQVRVLDFSK